jgi:regulator of sigma E protease
MDTFIYAAAIVLIFGAVILFHEAGHFLVAKLGRIRVDEFAMGLGPVIASVKRGETQYSLRAVPIGGMVRVAGMEEEEDIPEGFNNKPIGIRTAVIAAGPLMNIVLAAVIFCLSYTVFGKIVGVTPEIARVIRGKPAAVAGIRPGDKLVAVNDVTSADLDDLRQLILDSPGKTVKVVVERNGERLTLSVMPERVKVTEEFEVRNGKVVQVRKVEQWIGQVGIVFKSKRQRLPVHLAMAEGLKETWKTVSRVGESLLLVFKKKAPVEFSGPVGIVSMMYEQARVSWMSFLYFAGIFNIMIAFLNLVPFPALDGSRIMFLGIEAIRGRRIHPRKEAIVHTVGLVILLLFILAVTVGDIWKRWGPQ